MCPGLDNGVSNSLSRSGARHSRYILDSFAEQGADDGGAGAGTDDAAGTSTTRCGSRPPNPTTGAALTLAADAPAHPSSWILEVQGAASAALACFLTSSSSLFSMGAVDFDPGAQGASPGALSGARVMAAEYMIDFKGLQECRAAGGKSRQSKSCACSRQPTSCFGLLGS